MTQVIILALVAVACSSLAGYLLGVRHTQTARRALRAELEERGRALEAEQAKSEQLAQERAALRTSLNERIEALQRSLDAQDQSAHALRAEVMHSIQPIIEASSASNLLREELERVVSSIRVRERDSASLGRQVEDLLGTMLSKEKLGNALSGVVGASTGRSGLQELLNVIAQRAGMSTVLLADGVGLPLASSNSGDDPDALAAISSLWLSLSDKIGALGFPAPLAAVLKDESHQTILHRVFEVEQERFVLTAVSKGRYLPPDGLDPALSKIGQLLSLRAR